MTFEDIIEAVKNFHYHYIVGDSRTRDGIDPHVVAYADRTSQISETYRAISNRLDEGKKSQIILVTSSLPKEGKTTTACNLAATFASTLGKKTLLLDADLRKPKVHDLMGIPKRVGLGDLLKDEISLDSVLCQEPVRDLQIITAGSTVEKPEVLLNQQIMRDLLNALKKQFEIIIIDSAPVLKAADVRAIAPYVDFRLFVVKSGVTPKHIIDDALDSLRGTKSMPDSCLLTNVEKVPHYYTYLTQPGYRDYYKANSSYIAESSDDAREEPKRSNQIPSEAQSSYENVLS